MVVCFDFIYLFVLNLDLVDVQARCARTQRVYVCCMSKIMDYWLLDGG